jgi:hypothetical protein
MASLSDVESALQALIEAQIYPNGTPPAGSSVVGFPVKIYAGWPDPQQLDADLVETNGLPVASHVSIYPLPTERNTTRFPAEWVDSAVPAATYTIAASGQTITLGGTAPDPYVAQNLAAWVSGRAYVIQATAGQSAADVAAALCQAIQTDVPDASVSGAVITIPAGATLGDVVVGSTGTAAKEVRRQAKQFQIAVWTSNPTLRAQIADLFDPVLADTPRLALPDNSVGQLTYQATREDDFTQKQRIYRRSLIYTVEFATLRTMTAPQMVAGDVRVVDPFGDVIAAPQVASTGALDLNLGVDAALTTVV